MRARVALSIPTIPLLFSLSGLLVVLDPSPAAAVDVIVDSGPVVAKAGDDGQHEAELQLLNTADSMVDLRPSVPLDVGCAVTASPSALEPGRRTTVKLSLSRGCEVEEGTDVALALGGGTPTDLSVQIDPPKKESKPDWEVLALAAGTAIFAAAVMLVGMESELQRMNREDKLAKRVGKRLREKQQERSRQNLARAAKGYTAAGDAIVTLSDTGEPEDAEFTGRVGWTSELDQLGSSWSFKDSWISNVTLGGTALVALLAASDILEAVLGEKPKAALGIIAVAAGISAFLVGLGPLLVKAIGKKTSVPTVLGVTAAAAVVVAGSLFQVTAVALQAARLTDQLFVQLLVVFAGLLAGGSVYFYAGRSLIEFVETGTTPNQPSVEPEVRAAWIIARAIRPNLTDMYLSPLDISETLEGDKKLSEQLSQPEVRNSLEQEALRYMATVHGAEARARPRSAIL